MSDRRRPGSGPGRALPVHHRYRMLPPAVAALLLLLSACARPARPSIVLITIDALRVDRLGAYGAPRPVAPHLDAFVRDGARVERAWTTLPGTTPAIGSILTARFPKSHGARGLFDRLSGTNTTLAEILAKEGYATAAFTSGAFLAPGAGFEQGFALYDDPESRHDGDSAEAVTAAASAWLDGLGAETPFFLWVHYTDPLWRYDPGPPFDRGNASGAPEPFTLYDDLTAGRIGRGALIFGASLPERTDAHVKSLYDGEIERTDAAVGVLLKRLATPGRPLITAVTSDHGESLGEHGYHYAHGDYLYEETLRVPLLVTYPGVIAAGTILPGPVLNVDLAPTLLALAGVTGLQAAEGRPFLTVAGSGSGRRAVAAPGRPLVWAEGDPQSLYRENPRRYLEGPAGRWTAAGDGRHKLILIPRPAGEMLELYDLESDPAESTNRIADPALEPVRARLYRAVKEFADYGASIGTPDPERVRRLRSIGYFN